jgi:ribosomal protein L37AE/L43A
MADTEKDRYGSKLRDKEKGQEDDYFARRDLELLEKLRQERRGAAAEQVGTMQCPRCGTALQERVQHDITVDECPTCGGLWLDRGEMDQLARREEEGWFGRLLRGRPGGS